MSEMNIADDVQYAALVEGARSVEMMHNFAVDGSWDRPDRNFRTVVSAFEQSDSDQRAALIREALNAYIAVAIGSALDLVTRTDAVLSDPDNKHRRLRAKMARAVLNLPLTISALRNMLAPVQVSALHGAKATLTAR